MLVNSDCTNLVDKNTDAIMTDAEALLEATKNARLQINAHKQSTR